MVTSTIFFFITYKSKIRTFQKILLVILFASRIISNNGITLRICTRFLLHTTFLGKSDNLIKKIL